MRGSLTERHVILEAAEIDRMVRRMAMEISEQNPGLVGVALVGILTRGVTLSRRIGKVLESMESVRVPMGSLDITFYRDDFDSPDFDPEVKDTDLSFDVTGKRIVLVDDVLQTGRTIRAAMDAIIDFGRPAQIQLAILIDRGGRELPIAPTYVGKRTGTRKDEKIRVSLSETDGGDDQVFVVQRFGGPKKP